MDFRRELMLSSTDPRVVCLIAAKHGMTKIFVTTQIGHRQWHPLLPSVVQASADGL